MRSGFVIFVVCAIGFVCGCNQVENQPVYDNAVLEQLAAIQLEVVEIRHQIMHLRADIRKIQTSRTAAVPKTQPDTTVYKIAIDDSPFLGAKESAVTIVEFGDFQCPYCAREYPKIQQILKQYPEKVRFVFKHYPLRFHKKAPPAHAAAELARREQGPKAFWKMHDLIMANPKKLEIADLRGYAQSLDLDLEKFDAVMADPDKINDLLKADLAEACPFCKLEKNMNFSGGGSFWKCIPVVPGQPAVGS
jgi:protein-disulfide isomerase